MKILVAILLALVLFLSGYLLYLKYYSFNPPISVSQKNMSTNNSSGKVRHPAVAGSFYPAGPSELSEEIDGFLSNAEKEQCSHCSVPIMILVPHAGYQYSGQTAAYGYKLLSEANINKVILLGSSHNYPVSGVIADDSDSWETPLGKVLLDKKLIDKMQIPLNHEPFVPEHSLEVQLPFLQKTLKEDFKIVPILVGGMNSVETHRNASLLRKQVDENTVIVVSSDMSHYPSYEDASKCDHETMNSILTGDPDSFSNVIAKLEQKNIPAAVTFMCAKPAVELALAIARELKIKDIKLLDYSNSGDVMDDKSRVVGYSAIGFFENISQRTEGQKLLQIARDSVELFIKNGTMPKFSDLPVDTPASAGGQNFVFLQRKSGVFVTLRNSGELRGCIGLIESDQPLYASIPQMAVAAAVDDPRFSPVTEEDLPKLKYEVSVLSPMKRVSAISEIELGAHGVKIQKGSRSGVFLPQVAEETGWNKEEFLNHLCCDKAGLAEDCWKDPATEIYTFTAEVFSD